MYFPRIRPLAIGLLVLTGLSAVVPAEAARATRRTRASASSVARLGPQYVPDCQPRVKYLNDPCCGNLVTFALPVCHPCTGCRTEVEVCLPDCCTGAPEVFSRKTLIGCGLTRFTWCCGHSVTVRFEDCGDLVVIYR